jgi:hypothetical protein
MNDLGHNSELTVPVGIGMLLRMKE